MKKRFTKEELERTIEIDDVVQIVTPFLAGVGFLKRLDDNTLVLEPLDEQTIEDYTPKTNKVEEIEYIQAPTTVPATVIVALADINLVFKLTKQPKIQDGE